MAKRSSSLHLIDDLTPYAGKEIRRFRYKDKHGLEGIKELLKDVHGYSFVKLEPHDTYRDIINTLDGVIEGLKHSAFIIVGRSGLEHIHEKGIKKPLHIHGDRNKLFWLNIKRESELNYEKPVDPLSREMIAGLRNLAVHVPSGATIIIFDDVIKTGRVMRSISKKLREFMREEGKEPAKIVPLTLMLSGYSFSQTQDLLPSKIFNYIHSQEKLEEVLEDILRYVNIIKRVQPGNATKIQKRLRQEFGIEPKYLQSIVKKFDHMYAPISGLISSHQHVNTLSHELSDTVELMYEKPLTKEEEELAKSLSAIVAARGNKLEPYKSHTRQLVRMVPRTRV